MTAFLKTNTCPHHEQGSLPFGKELYATYAKQWTTTEMSPEKFMH
jgi:uncharacterized protein (DUF885 family)